MAAAKTTAVRVLAGHFYAGRRLEPNDIIELTETAISANPGCYDAAPEAVQAAREAGGRVVALD